MSEERPVVVCLCGSTRFKDAYLAAALRETLAGRIVLSVGTFMHADSVSISDEQKVALDELHLRKIDMADEILILDIDDYVGWSTSREIEYAKTRGKHVRFASDESPLDLSDSADRELQMIEGLAQEFGRLQLGRDYTTRFVVLPDEETRVGFLYWWSDCSQPEATTRKQIVALLTERRRVQNGQETV